MTDRAQWSGKEGGEEGGGLLGGGRWAATLDLDSSCGLWHGDFRWFAAAFSTSTAFFVARRRERDPKTERQRARARLVEC